MKNNTSRVTDFLAAANKYASLYAKKPHIATHYAKDDLLSECYLALRKGEKDYKDDQGMKFTSYMIQRIKWRLMEIDRKCAKMALKGDGFMLSLSAMDDSKEDIWHPSIEYDNDTISMLDCLSDRDKDIVVRHTINNETFSSIAESYNVSGMSVCNWHTSAIDTLKKKNV
jgi:RNA polymerase sigma factor (sigma-70 family)